MKHKRPPASAEEQQGVADFLAMMEAKQAAFKDPPGSTNSPALAAQQMQQQPHSRCRHAVSILAAQVLLQSQHLLDYMMCNRLDVLYHISLWESSTQNEHPLYDPRQT